MEQEQQPEDTQLHHISSEEQRPASRGQAQPVRQVYRCSNCEIEFFWSPTVVQGKMYCCTGCASGGPCNCDYSLYRSVTIMGVIHYEQ
jgi:hypothetical protein